MEMAIWAAPSQADPLPSPKLPAVVTLPGTPKESKMWVRSKLLFWVPRRTPCNPKHWRGASPNVNGPQRKPIKQDYHCGNPETRQLRRTFRTPLCNVYIYCSLPWIRCFRVHLKLIQICTPCHFSRFLSIHAQFYKTTQSWTSIFSPHKGNVHQFWPLLQHFLTYKKGRCIWRMTETSEYCLCSVLQQLSKETYAFCFNININ